MLQCVCVSCVARFVLAVSGLCVEYVVVACRVCDACCVFVS